MVKRKKPKAPHEPMNDKKKDPVSVQWMRSLPLDDAIPLNGAAVEVATRSSFGNVRCELVGVGYARARSTESCIFISL